MQKGYREVMSFQRSKPGKTVPWSKVWKIVSNPQGFFSSLNESSAVPAMWWMTRGIAVMVFLGGFLSVVFSVLVGVPSGDVLAFVASDKTWLAYVIFLVLWFFKLVGFSIIELCVFHASAKMLKGTGSFAKTAQLLGYSSTPVFLAFSLPQVLAKDFSILHPLVRVVATSFNYSIDLLQVASLVWGVWLMHIGSKELHCFSKLRSWMFVIIPGVGMVVLVGVYLALEGLVIG